MKETGIDKAAVRTFVRGTLGCTCPDSVFEHIELEEHTTLLPDLTLSKRYTIGNRLLIYLLNTETYDPGLITGQLEKIIGAGKAERDRRGLNRFRLVLVSREPTPLEQQINAQLAVLPGLDERVHVHVIEP